MGKKSSGDAFLWFSRQGPKPPKTRGLAPLAAVEKRGPRPPREKSENRKQAKVQVESPKRKAEGIPTKTKKTQVEAGLSSDPLLKVNNLLKVGKPSKRI